ncbi:MAG: MBL fold metallo-hydrolase, partial [Candidatus Aenigmatarchaeota archaeon]
MNNLKIIPIASDSMGVRSFCIQVITDDANILIDPSVSLAPIRFGCQPHAIELQKMDEIWNEILKLSKEVDIILITHYHFDHFSWDEPEQFKNKILLIKHPTEKINFNQKNRARYFLDRIKNLPKRLEYCDGKKYEFGKVKIKFSQPVFHGVNPKLGYVEEVLIENDGYKFIYTSDVEGPSQEDQVSFILENKPNLLFLDGPLSYILYRFGMENLKVSIQNMIKIIEECPIETLVIDHHFLRDLKWKEKISKVFEVAEKKEVKVQCVAEFLGKPIEMLEARRKE